MNIEHESQYKKWGAKLGLKEMDFLILKIGGCFMGYTIFLLGSNISLS
jgi:hypothetical protein